MFPVNPYRTPQSGTSGVSRYVDAIQRGTRIAQRLYNWQRQRQQTQNRNRRPVPMGKMVRVYNVTGGGRSKRHRKFKKKLSLKSPHVKGRVKRGKRKRIVRVSRRLKKAIKKGAWESLPKGFFEVVSTDAFAIAPSANAQQYGVLLESRPTAGSNGWFFTPTQLLEAASVLFNGYQSNTSWAFNNIAIDAVTGAVKTGYMDPESTEFYVKKSWARVCWKNFGPRTLYLRVYIAKPKIRDSWVPTNSIPGPLDSTKVNTPIGMWNSILTREAQGSNFQSGPKNVLNNTISTLYQDPRNNSALNKYYDFDCIKIDLAPGQCYDHIIKGPQDMLFRGASYLDGQPGSAGYLMKDIQKFSRNVFITCNYDLLGASDAGGALASGLS